MDPKVSEIAKNIRANQKRNKNNPKRQLNKHKERLERLHVIDLNAREGKRKSFFIK